MSLIFVTECAKLPGYESYTYNDAVAGSFMLHGDCDGGGYAAELAVYHNR